MGNKYVSKSEYLARTKGERSRKRMPRLANKSARKGLAKLVTRIVARQQETKYVSEYLRVPNGSSVLQPPTVPGFGLTTFTSAITGSGELYACLPQLTEGAGSFQRVGDKIHPVSCRVDLLLECGGYQNLNTFDITAHIFVISCKAVKSLANYSAIPTVDLLRQGNGTTAPFDGTIQNLLLPFNTTEYVLHSHQTVHFNKSDGETNGALDSSGVPNRPTQGGVIGLYKRSVKISLPKVLTYNTDAAVYPNNSAPVLCIGWVRNDDKGTTAPSPQRPIGVLARTHMWFKDT